MSGLPAIGLGIDGWTLRAWCEGDAPSLAAHADNVNVWRHMSDRFPHPYTLAIAEHWVRHGHVDFGGDNWAIAFEDQAVGGCGIHVGSGQFRCNADIGYWLAQAHWGRGIVTRVARALIDRAFADPEITPRLRADPRRQPGLDARGREGRHGARERAAAECDQGRPRDRSRGLRLLPRGALTSASPPQNFCGRITSTSLRNVIIE